MASTVGERFVDDTSFSIRLSSDKGEFGRWFLVGLMVAKHGPLDVDAPAGQGEYGLGVPLALGSLMRSRPPGHGDAADGDPPQGPTEVSCVAAVVVEVCTAHDHDDSASRGSPGTTGKPAPSWSMRW
jgi:hypothetical protein